MNNKGEEQQIIYTFILSIQTKYIERKIQFKKYTSEALDILNIK